LCSDISFLLSLLQLLLELFGLVLQHSCLSKCAAMTLALSGWKNSKGQVLQSVTHKKSALLPRLLSITVYYCTYTVHVYWIGVVTVVTSTRETLWQHVQLLSIRLSIQSFRNVQGFVRQSHRVC
jgi:hypothetical protein